MFALVGGCELGQPSATRLFNQFFAQIVWNLTAAAFVYRSLHDANEKTRHISCEIDNFAASRLRKLRAILAYFDRVAMYCTGSTVHNTQYAYTHSWAFGGPARGRTPRRWNRCPLKLGETRGAGGN